MVDERLRQIAYILYCVGFGVTFLVTLLYGIVARWHKTSSGLQIFGLLLSLTLILANVIVRVFFPQWPFGVVLAIILFGLYIFAIAYMGFGIYSASVGRYIRRRNNPKVNQ